MTDPFITGIMRHRREQLINHAVAYFGEDTPEIRAWMWNFIQITWPTREGFTSEQARTMAHYARVTAGGIL